MIYMYYTESIFFGNMSNIKSKPVIPVSLIHRVPLFSEDI